MNNINCMKFRLFIKKRTTKKIFNSSRYVIFYFNDISFTNSQTTKPIEWIYFFFVFHFIHIYQVHLNRL